MKKCLSLILVFILLFSSFSVTTFAWDGPKKYNYKGFVYTNEYGDRIEIVNYKGKKTKVTIPKKIKGIKVWRIYKYGNIEQLHIPDGIEALYLSKAKKLKKITVNKTNEKYAVKNRLLVSKDGTIVYGCPGAITKPKIPKAVTTIGESAFEGTSIKKITLPENVKNIDYGAFSYCKKLKTVNFNKKIRVIDNYAFKGCTSLKSIVIPNTVKDFRAYVFWDCKNLESVKLSKHTRWLSNTFTGCTSLKTVKIPKKVEFITDASFAGCTSLESIKIPKSVKRIDYYAFSNCKSLKEIKIPESVKKIGESAFKGCDSLEKIYIYNKKCNVFFHESDNEELHEAFDAIPEHITIYSYKGSRAQKYAEQKGNEFVELEIS